MLLTSLTKDSTLEQVSQELRKLARESGRDPLTLQRLQLEIETIFKNLNYPSEWKRLIKPAFTKIKRSVLKSHESNKFQAQDFTPSPIEKNIEKSQLVDSKGLDENTPQNSMGVGEKLPFSAVTVANLRTKLSEHLDWHDPDALEVMLGAAAAHEFNEPETQPWLLIIAPPSGGKTELVDMLNQLPKVLPLDQITKKTFFSGLSPEDSFEGSEPSLLVKHPNAILTFKDLTTLLSVHADDRKLIFGQLRSVFDGRFSYPFGTGQHIAWEGHISFIAGVTHVIDHQHSMMSQLGPRFLFLRLQQPSRQDQVKWTLLQTASKQWKVEMQLMVRQLIMGLPKIIPTVPTELLNTLAALADVVSRVRSVTNRDKDGDLTDVPEAELPARVAHQLMSLAQGLALIHYRDSVNSEDIKRVMRVGFDTLPPGRKAVLSRLRECVKATRPQIRKGTTYSDTMIANYLEELELLGVVQSIGEYGEQYWEFTPEVYNLIKQLDVVDPILTSTTKGVNIPA